MIQSLQQLNNNMRCFEILKALGGYVKGGLLNNNMRCFEIVMTDMVQYMPHELNNNMRCFEISKGDWWNVPVPR